VPGSRGVCLRGVCLRGVVMGASAWLLNLISRLAGLLRARMMSYWVVPVRKICSGWEAMTR
jgi:hypothetical protein